MTEEWEELEAEEDEGIYNEGAREDKVDDGEIEDWEGAWMQGYDEG